MWPPFHFRNTWQKVQRLVHVNPLTLGCQFSYCFCRLAPIVSKAFCGLIDRGSAQKTQSLNTHIAHDIHSAAKSLTFSLDLTKQPWWKNEHWGQSYSVKGSSWRSKQWLTLLNIQVKETSVRWLQWHITVDNFSIFRHFFLLKSKAGFGKIAAARQVEILMRVNQYGMKNSRI